MSETIADLLMYRLILVTGPRALSGIRPENAQKPKEPRK
jgi:hypothetical protein